MTVANLLYCRAVLKKTVPQMQQVAVDYKREVSKAKARLPTTATTVMSSQATIIIRTRNNCSIVSGDLTLRDTSFIVW